MLAFCEWNPVGGTVPEACPGLYEIIRNKKHWRAVILNTESIRNYQAGFVPDRDNPFDYSQIDRDSRPHESRVPLIRLTHILAGYPDLPKIFTNEISYFDDETQQTVCCMEDEITPERSRYIHQNYDDVKRRVVEKPQDPEALDQYQKLCVQYDFICDRPEEIFLVGTRSKSDERSLSMTSMELRTAQARHQDWKYNHYPEICRFLVFDFARQGSAWFSQDLLQFCLSILTLGMNEIPSEALKPNRLYQLGIDISEEAFQGFINHHLDNLGELESYLNEELKNIPESSYRSDLAFYSDMPIVLRTNEKDEIAVVSYDVLDNFQETAAQAGSDKINREYQSLATDSANPRRAIDDGAAQLKRSISAHAEGITKYLDPYQFEYLNEKVEQVELKVFSSRPKNLYDRSKQIQELKSAARALYKYNRHDEHQASLLVAGVVAVMLASVGFFSYLYDAWQLGTRGFLYSLGLTAIVLTITAIGGRLALPIHKGKQEKLNANIFEQARNAIQKPVDITKNNFEKYFTNINTLMYGKALQAGAFVGDDYNSTQRKLIKRHLKCIIKTRKRDEDYLKSCHLRRVVSAAVGAIEQSFDASVAPDENPFYDFAPGSQDDEIMLNNTGDTLVAPYPFIVAMQIAEEETLDAIGEACP